MEKAHVDFVSDAQELGAKPPVSITGEASFELIKPYLSDRPLRRYRGEGGRPFTPSEARSLAAIAAQNPPPKAWLEEDFAGLQ